MTDDWDAAASTFDDEPDHGLRDPAVRAAWADVLLPLVPEGSDVLDLGCGTGSLAVLLAGAGRRVTGVDASAAMLAVARAKASGLAVDLVSGDAADPPVPPGSADVVLCRHVLWALGDPAAAVGRWVRLLRPGGRLVLVEGRWGTGAGLSAADCRDLVLRHRLQADVRQLADQPALWGGPVSDERYLLLSRR